MCLYVYVCFYRDNDNVWIKTVRSKPFQALYFFFQVCNAPPKKSQKGVSW